MRAADSAVSDGADLVQKAKHGCEESFSTLIERNRRIVYALAWAALKHGWDVEDAVQETFILSFRKLSSLRQPDRFRPWLIRIAQNVNRKHIKAEQLRRERYVRIDERTSCGLWDGFGDRTDFTGEEQQMIRRCLERLSKEDRSVVTLFYLLDLDQRSIAELLDIPLGTVKSRLNRSRILLKERYTAMSERDIRWKSEDDYGRSIIQGMRGLIKWRRLIDGEVLSSWNALDGSSLPNEWRQSGDAIIGEDRNETVSPLITGDESWEDYEFSVLVTPISGGNAQVFFRMSKDRKESYLLDLLMGWQAIALSLRREGRVEKLSVVNLALSHNQEYDIQIAARGRSLATYVDGRLANQVTDSNFASGGIGLNVWQCKTAYRDPRVRLLH